MKRKEANLSTRVLKQNIILRKYNSISNAIWWVERCYAAIALEETELFARAELNEWECQAMLASFLLPSNQLPKDLRKFREAPEGGTGMYMRKQIGVEESKLGKDIFYPIFEETLLPSFEYA